jgi:NMT1/THI5 like protein
VRTLEDLEGKVVGVGSIGALIHQLTVTLLRKYSVDVSTVRFVNIGSNTDTFKGVMAGTVDAGAGPASFVDDAESYKVHAIANGNMSVELKEFTYQAGWTSQRVIDSKRTVLVRVLAAYAKLFRFVHEPSAQDAFLKARKAVFPDAPEREHQGEWNYLQTFKPFATDLMLSPERARYMQQINLDFHVQNEMLPFERVADMSLAQDAQKLPPERRPAAHFARLTGLAASMAHCGGRSFSSYTELEADRPISPAVGYRHTANAETSGQGVARSDPGAYAAGFEGRASGLDEGIVRVVITDEQDMVHVVSDFATPRLSTLMATGYTRRFV